MRRASTLAFAVLCGLLLQSASPASALSPEEQAARIQIKRQVFGGLGFQRAEQVAAGQAQPLMAFEARDSFFVNWVIPRRNVAAFEAALGLPEGFHLTPIRIVRGERPRYFLSLNIYEVTIGAPALRAEWSVYVTVGDDPTPRFMVIEAQSNAPSFDPALGERPAVDLQYERGEGTTRATLNAPEGHFEIRFDEPCQGLRDTRLPTLQWAQANDYIYWGNGVADKAFYNGSLTRAPMTAVDPRAVDIVDGTRWAQFVRPRPAHVLLFNEPLAFALHPWANLEDPALPLDPAQRAALLAVKAQVFSQLAQLDASKVMDGSGEPLVDFQVDMDAPAYFINFRVPLHKVHALAEAIGLPEGFHLAPMSALRRQRPEFMISLNVYKASGVAAGLRAEWSVYVTPDDDPFARYFMVIDVATDGPSMDVVNLATPPAAVFTHGQDELGVSRTQIVTVDGSSFGLTFEMPGADVPSAPIHQAWVRANDRIYWRNGVYDLALYNGTLIDADIAVVDPATVQVDDQTPWASFVEPEPLEVLVFRNALELTLHPWYNLEELPVSAPAPAE